jgi:hypothetical protein
MTITCLVGGKPDHKTQEIPKNGNSLQKQRNIRQLR